MFFLFVTEKSREISTTNSFVTVLQIVVGITRMSLILLLNLKTIM